MTDILKSNQRQKNQIYWHKKDIKIELESWSSEELVGSAENTTIYAPGPKTEPPFEVKIIASRFMYEGEKETTLYIIRIGSLMHSWLLLKSMQNIIDLVNLIKENSEILNRLNIKRFKSVSVDSYQERIILIQLILSTLLNNSTYYKYIQHFILTNTIAETENQQRIESILEQGTRDMVYLIEHTGWIARWRVRYFHLYNNIIVNISLRTGKIKSVISIKDIKIIDKTIKIKDKELIAHDTKTVEIIKRWMHQCVI